MLFAMLALAAFENEFISLKDCMDLASVGSLKWEPRFGKSNWQRRRVTLPARGLVIKYKIVYSRASLSILKAGPPCFSPTIFRKRFFYTSGADLSNMFEGAIKLLQSTHYNRVDGSGGFIPARIRNKKHWAKLFHLDEVKVASGKPHMVPHFSVSCVFPNDNFLVLH